MNPRAQKQSQAPLCCVHPFLTRAAAATQDKAGKDLPAPRASIPKEGVGKVHRPCRGLSAELLLLLPPFFYYTEEKIRLAHLLPRLVPFSTFLAKFNLIFSAALVRFPI